MRKDERRRSLMRHGRSPARALQSAPAMTNVEGIFYSFNIDEIPRLRALKETLFADSVHPPGFDPSVLPIHEEQHVRGRRRLDEKPDFDDTIEEEREIYQAKRQARETRLPGQPYVIRRTYIRRLDSKIRLSQFKKDVKSICGGKASFTGDFIYYPGSYREWHTNIFDLPGWRMYMVDVAEEGRSGFRYVSPKTGDVMNVLDRRGQVNFFHLDPNRPLLHCVHSDTIRWSKGFQIPDNWRDLLFQ